MNNYRFLIGRLHDAFSELRHLPWILRLVWSAARTWTLAWLVLLIVQALLPVASVYLTKALVDSLVAVLDAGTDWDTARTTLSLAVLMALLMLMTEILGSLARWVRTAQAELIQDHISALIHHKSATVDLAFYDSPEYFDHLHRARTEARYRPIVLLENSGGLLQNGITLAAMAAVLVPFGLILPLALLLSTLPALYTVLRYSVRQHHWRLRTTRDERLTWYYDSLLTQTQPAAELRLFHLADHFQTLFQQLRAQLRKERLDLEQRQSLAELAASMIGLSITGAAILWMVWQTLQGRVTLGSLALVYQAFNQGQKLMRTLLENTGQIYYSCLFLGNLNEFLTLKNTILAPHDLEQTDVVLNRDIRFEHVTFHYPDNPHPVLSDFNLTVPASKVVALVGPNGSGKSTLIKLLCRFYDPGQGRLTIDGVDLRRFAVNDLRRSLTVLFQEPIHYSTTAAENIALGDLTVGMDPQPIKSAAAAAGADDPITRLPQGYDTLLGKWFGGYELSVGEWQRLALARAFFRKSALIILDEPTSAMDAWAEADWMGRFHELAAGCTSIIITHRFSTAMKADIIHVIDEGHVIESGNHEELIDLDGRYAQAWKGQSGNRWRDKASAGTPAEPGSSNPANPTESATGDDPIDAIKWTTAKEL